MTESPECRFRSVTFAQFLSLKPAARKAKLREIYWENISRLNRTLSFCDRHDIRLFRVSSALFPMSDLALGRAILLEFAANLSSIGRRARRLGIRIVIHPDQFVVLNSESPKVAANSEAILEKHALWLDLMDLPKSPFAAMIVHGGKSGRAEQLIAAITALPDNVRNRLCLENDEYAYSAEEILTICRRAKVPMIFDNLHHAVQAKLANYDDASVQHYVEQAAKTWPKRAWQIVHLSNGHESFADRFHSRLIVDVPTAYAKVPWVEIEARGKELAIFALRDKITSMEARIDLEPV